MRTAQGSPNVFQLSRLHHFAWRNTSALDVTCLSAHTGEPSARRPSRAERVVRHRQPLERRL